MTGSVAAIACTHIGRHSSASRSMPRRIVLVEFVLLLLFVEDTTSMLLL